MHRFHFSFIATIGRLTEFSARRALWLVIGATLVSALLLDYTIKHFAVNTNTLDMLDSRLPFRQAQLELERTFPQLARNIVIVVEATSALRARDLARQLAERLRHDTQNFESVYEPAGESIFVQNGLLYLDIPELEDLALTLAKAQPMLGALTEDMSLKGLFRVLGRALDQGLSTEDEKLFVPVIDRISQVVESQLAKHPEPISWENMLYGDSMLSAGGSRGFVLVKPRHDYSQVESASEPVQLILEHIARMAFDPARERFRLTGEPVMDNEELGNAIDGILVSGLLSFTLVAIITVWGLRSLRHIVAILFTLAAGLIFTAAFATAMIGALNVISINFAILFIGMGVDFGIQVGLRYKEESGAGHNHLDAIRRTGSGLGKALTLAAMAAALSFFSFLPTSYLGLAELGVISGMGMGIAWFLNLTLLPALLTVLPKSWEFRQKVSQAAIAPGFDPGSHRRVILWAFALVALGSVFLLPRVRFDFNPLNMKNQTSEAVVTFKELLADPTTSPYTISVVTPNLESAKALALKVGALPSVDKAITLEDFIPEQQDEKLAIIDEMNLLLGPSLSRRRPAVEPDPDREAQAVNEFEQKLKKADETKLSSSMAASLTRLQGTLNALQSTPDWPEPALSQLRENVIGDLPETLDVLRKLLDPTGIQSEDLPKALTDRYLSRDGRARLEVFSKEDLRDNDALRRFVREVQSIAPNATDSAAELLEGGDAVVRATFDATVLAFIATALLLFAVLRRVFDALLILIPLLFAMFLTAATSVLIGIPFDLANIIALPLLLGLSNAYGIYLVLRLRSAGSVKKLFSTYTPKAILFSTLTDICAFGTLAFSPHRGLSGIGILVTLSLSFAVLATLLLLPAILAVRESRRKDRRLAS
ncbi:MAG: MMPL family transporter [Gammaproteobacteria bacterium]